MGAASIMGAASMKKILLTTVALTALVATSAMAADVGVYGAPPAGSGLSGLFALLQMDWLLHRRSRWRPVGAQGMGRPRAVLGRLRLSIRGRFCCWRCAGDYAWSGAKNSKASILFPGAINQSKVNSLASVTGRLGYAWDRFLGYLSDIAASEPLVIRPFPLRPGLRAGASPAARQLLAVRRDPPFCDSHHRRGVGSV